MFYHPMGLCEIWTPNQQHVWKLHAPAAYVPQDDTITVYPFLTGITVTMEMDRIAACQVTFDAPYDAGIQMLSEDKNGASPFNLNNLVRVCIGYPAQNTWTPWYYGSLQQGGDGVSITPEGVNGTLTIQMSNWQDSHVAKGTSAWAGSAQAFVDNLIALMGAKVIYSDGVRARMSEADQRKVTWCNFGKSIEHGLRNFCTITGAIRIVHQTNDKGDPALIEFVLPSEESSSDNQLPIPITKFIMRGKFDPVNGTYPIISWGPEEGVASWAGSKSSATNEGVSSAVINPLSGRVVKHVTPPYDESFDRAAYGKYLGKGIAQDIVTEDGKVINKQVDEKTATTSFLPSTPCADMSDTQTEEEIHAASVAFMKDGNAAQLATLKTLGLPSQGMWRKIYVLGCSPRYDGPYMVKGFTHSWSAGQFDTELKIVRQGTFGTAENKPAEIRGQTMSKDS